MNASNLKKGQKAIIVGYKSHEIEPKLMQFGFVVGEEISFCYKAPLGCPLALEVGTTIVSLRKEEAANLLIELIEN